MERKDIEKLVRERIEAELGRTGRREYIVAANWKMNMSAKSVRRFIGRLRETEIPAHLKAVIFPPFPYLHILQDMLRYDRITYGGQDVAKEESGAYTGEVSAAMLADCGCTYALIGHSERRSYYGDTPRITAGKAAAALDKGLTPVICIGESLEERRAGRYRDVLKGQLDAVYAGIGERMTGCVVAYEPVWAIGTGVIPGLSDIEETHGYIHGLLGTMAGNEGKTVPVLYGGSVKPDNIRDIASVRHVGGFLIGGASLDIESYTDILGLLSEG